MSLLEIKLDEILELDLYSSQSAASVMYLGNNELDRTKHKKLNQAVAKIYSNIDEEIKQMIYELEDPRSVWKALKQIFLPSSLGRVVGIFFFAR